VPGGNFEYMICINRGRGGNEGTKLLVRFKIQFPFRKDEVVVVVVVVVTKVAGRIV
jgi:hypothetical protein